MKYKVNSMGKRSFAAIHGMYLSCLVFGIAYFHFVEGLFPDHAFTLDSLIGITIFYAIWPGIPSVLFLLLCLEKKDVRTNA